MDTRPATGHDEEAIWRILEPVVRAGETCTLPADMSRAQALAYWLAPGQETFVAAADALLAACRKPSCIRAAGMLMLSSCIGRCRRL